MVIFPNAKINIGLNIVEKRADGYHNIETIFYPVGLCDVLEIIPSGKTVFFNEGIKVDSEPDKNLVMKAYGALNKIYKLPPVEIHLYKKIPFGSGLGGGSSDAAKAIELLNTMFELKMTEEQMLKTASEMGSDCAFFIKNKSSYASGKGDVLEKFELNLKGKYLLLVCPDIKVNTAFAYSGIKPMQPKESLKSLAVLKIEDWRGRIENGFEKTVFAKFPELSKIKDQLYKSGAVYASMSGSGSSVYGIFNEPATVDVFEEHFCHTEVI